MKKRKLMSMFVAIMCTVSLFGCGSKEEKGTSQKQKSETKKQVTIGCMPLNQEGIQAISDMMKKEGYDIEVKVFDGNNLPAEALSADEIDALILNHKPWIETFNKENGSHLVMVDGFRYASLNGIYSSKHKSTDEIPEGGTITISNDPSNMDRGLRFLEKLGFLKLGNKTGDYYTVLDIKENPKNIQFLEVETTSTAGSYKDVDATITFSSAMRNAGYDASSFMDEDGEYKNFPTGLVVNEGHENEQWVKDIIKVTQTDTYKEKFDEIFQGAYMIY